MRLPSTTPASPPSAQPLMSLWDRQLLTGHRGAAAYARANSLASFLLAIEMGADVLECDVRTTRDQALVLAHDGIIGRGRSVARIAWETEADLRARVPDLLSLADLLPVVRARDLLLNVDLKVPEAEVALVGMLTAHDMIGRTVVTSRASYQLRRLRALAPAVRLGLSKGSSPPRGPHGAPEWAALVAQRPLLPRALPDILRRARADAAYLHYRLITPPLVAALHRAGFALHAWTVDEPGDAERLIRWGVDGITTNRPDRIRPLVPATATIPNNNYHDKGVNMAVTILTEEGSWTIPPRSPKESAYRIVRRDADRWAVQATTAERYHDGGDWFAPFASVLTAEESCTALLRRMATQIKDRAYLDEVVHAITRLTGAPPPEEKGTEN